MDLPSQNGAILGGTLAGSLVVVGGLLGLLFFLRHKREMNEAIRRYGYGQPNIVKESSKPTSYEHKIPESSGSINSSLSVHSNSTPTQRGTNTFTYEELFEATNGFSDDYIIGQGGFGYVYQGILSNGKVAAIKQLKLGSFQGEREFSAEIDIISRIHHKNLVSLIGYSIDGNQKLLVYEFMANNSLAYHLHASEAKSELRWDTRMQIAIGSAKGLAYLHEDCDPKIIHRDIKATNILLDSNFKAKVSDFGLAKFVADAETHVTTRVMGTFGYIAPEYASSGKLTEKSDVYSFGIVLLELISGRAPMNLVEWVCFTVTHFILLHFATKLPLKTLCCTIQNIRSILFNLKHTLVARPLIAQAMKEGIYDELADPKLGNRYDNVEMGRMVACVEACIHPFANKRPQMIQSQHTRKLENDVVRTQRGRKTFTYEELFEATNGFSDDNLLGQGGFGLVYQGVLSNGKDAAIKQLKVGSFQGESEFFAEINVISRIHHKNLVSLIGYSIDGKQKLLCCCYMIAASEAKSELTWDTRMQIAIGSAKGLTYLHEFCE
ncbi:Proline-rich receptor-like protein kinase PERK1 [Bienertia sinuspersici]